uniref:Uncharacterized protein n=1 Tax=Trypanosoma congolense (strain IL3000) TaxID=1068625 RepID=G0UKP7_TRYCI|nr:hypothetical protein, unlikely [Trypanosoma congolense IL3000]
MSVFHRSPRCLGSGFDVFDSNGVPQAPRVSFATPLVHPSRLDLDDLLEVDSPGLASLESSPLADDNTAKQEKELRDAIPLSFFLSLYIKYRVLLRFWHCWLKLHILFTGP